MNNSKSRLIVISAVLLAMLTGCYSANPEDIAFFKRPDEVNVTSDKYILQPADVIQIQASKIPELHLQEQQIRPDGKVTFETIGSFEAAGKTPEQLADLMYQKASELYALTTQHPIDVRILEFHSSYYYVLGQVYLGGPKEATGRDSALFAIALAKPSVLASIGHIQVIRPSDDGDPKIFELDYGKMIVHGDTSKDVLLQEGDIVYVPPTILARVGLFLEQLLTPVGRAFSTVNVVQGPPSRRQ